MKAKRQQELLAMGQNESPVEFFRRVRRAILAQYDNDLSKYMKSLREEEKKHMDRLIDPKSLPK